MRNVAAVEFDMAKTARITHSCSLKIVEDVRKCAAGRGIAKEETLKCGIQAISKEFVKKGAEICAKV